MLASANDQTIVLIAIAALVLVLLPRVLRRAGPKQRRSARQIPKPVQTVVRPTALTAAPEANVEVEVVSRSGRSSREIDCGPLTQAGDGGWTLNPRSPLPLTMTGIGRGVADEIKAQLETGHSRGTYEVAESLCGILASSNARCREVDGYVRKYRREYLKGIEARISKSPEWATASDLDKEDLLSEFREAAEADLDVRPYTGVQELFDSEPSDFTLDDRLLARYGYDLLKAYLDNRGRARAVARVPADHYHRRAFERLVEVGLARRGSDVPTAALLKSLTLKVMREIVADLSPPAFARKAKAIEFIASLPDARERVGRVVSFREVFELLPLPSEFADVDLDKVAATWRYTRVVAELIAHTYSMGAFSVRDQDNYHPDQDWIRGWEIDAVSEGSCSMCRRAAATKYATGTRPQVPLHVGCRCGVQPVLDE